VSVTAPRTSIPVKIVSEVLRVNRQISAWIAWESVVGQPSSMSAVYVVEEALTSRYVLQQLHASEKV